MEFKNTLIKSITAVICVLAICLTMVSAIGNLADAKIKAAESAGNASVSAGENADTSDDTYVEDDTVTDDTIADDGTATDDTVVEDNTVADDTTADEPTQAPSDDKTQAEATKPAGNTMPKTTAEILSFYNGAVSKAVSAKVGYNKTRMTDNENMDGSAGLKLMKSLVYQFMGIGADNMYTEAVAKGNWGDRAYLFNSKLTAADVTSATCTQSGDNYVITLKLKSGSSAAGQSNPTTAPNTSLDKCGICVGSEDKGYFDHKTASVIYDAIAGTYAGAEIKESYSNATVKATVNATTGNIVSLVIEWNQSVTLSKLAGMSATATGVSHVTYKDFKY